jgi:hypothetical protein
MVMDGFVVRGTTVTEFSFSVFPSWDKGGRSCISDPTNSTSFGI